MVECLSSLLVDVTAWDGYLLGICASAKGQKVLSEWCSLASEVAMITSKMPSCHQEVIQHNQT